jgi:ubiquinone/menaquinone biosynthesis C-methylase UbiE
MKINPPTRATRPDYGIDAPGVRRAMLIAGSIGLITTIAPPLIWNGSRIATWISAFGLAVAAYGLFMSSYMTYGSRIGKLRNREKLLDLAAKLRSWTGDETVLDVGCGRGLMLVGAARRLTTGHAVGIDLWRDEDQAENSPEALEVNARSAGVADRIRIDTGDARQLPYPNASFDVVLSHWVIHNLPKEADRQKALDEMLRVLRPSGVLVLADIANIGEYRAYLTSKGIKDMRTLSGGTEAVIMGALSGGSYRPQALLALRP